MTQKILDILNAVILDVKKFIEADKPWEVPLNHVLTEREVMDEYAKFINYDNKLTDYMKKVDYLLYTLYEAKFQQSSNTPQGQKAINQLNAYMEQLRALRKALDDINSGHYLVGKYFEKGGGNY